MAGSEAEERIRGAAEARLRRAYPEARIIHELVVGNCRLDLAVVEPDRLVLVEIKSERDTLTRLPAQLKAALQVTSLVTVYAAEKHRAALHTMRSEVRDPSFLPDLARATVLIEAGDRFDLLSSPFASFDPLIAAPRVWQLMWAAEMRTALARHTRGAPGQYERLPMSKMTRLAVELMSGREIRRATCLALRERSFPRADPPASMQEATRAA